MKRTLIIFFSTAFFLLALSGCSRSTWLYRVNVQQGNIITSEMVHQLRPGMSKEMVADILGPPVLMDAFNESRWTYVFTYKGNKSVPTERMLIIHFRNGHICNMSTKNME